HEASNRTGGKPSLHQCQQALWVADDVGEQPIDRSDGMRIEREGAFAPILDAGKASKARIERRLVDADDARAQPLQHPAPAAGTGGEIDAALGWLGPLTKQGEQLPELEVGSTGRRTILDEAHLAVWERT